VYCKILKLVISMISILCFCFSAHGLTSSGVNQPFYAHFSGGLTVVDSSASKRLRPISPMEFDEALVFSRTIEDIQSRYSGVTERQIKITKNILYEHLLLIDGFYNEVPDINRYIGSTIFELRMNLSFLDYRYLDGLMHFEQFVFKKVLSDQDVYSLLSSSEFISVVEEMSKSAVIF